MKAIKYNFEEIDAKQPTLIVRLAPTSEDGGYGEAVIQFNKAIEPREIKGTTKQGKPFAAMRYEIVAVPVEGMYADIINKEEVAKKDPKSGRIIGKELIPKVYSADELNKIMEERGNDGVIIRLSQTSYELIKKNVENGKIKNGDILKLEYSVWGNGGVTIKKIYRANPE